MDEIEIMASLRCLKLKTNHMKKITSFLAVGIMMIGAAMAQGEQVAGMQFAQNQKNYNNRQVMVTGITVTFENAGGPGQQMAGGPAGAPHAAPHGAPGAKGAQTAPCNPPVGSQKLKVSIKEDPEWTACVFMSEAMVKQLKAKAGAQSSVTVSLSLKGDASRGYQATMFK